MINSTTITLRGEALEVRELTVAQLDRVIGAMEQSEHAEASALETYYKLLYNVTPGFVTASCGLDVEAQGELSPTELAQLVQAVEEVNSAFLDQFNRVMARAAELLGQKARPSSAAPSASAPLAVSPPVTAGSGTTA